MVPETFARDRLVEIVARDGVGRVAVRCGVAHSVVLRWLSGQQRPTFPQRKALMNEWALSARLPWAPRKAA
jgi:hypothetical protein